MTGEIYPDLVALRKVRGSITIAGVAAGATVTQTITLKETYLIIGMPKVSTPTADCTVKLVNGGKNEFTVEATNGGAAAVDIVVEYETYVLEGA